MKKFYIALVALLAFTAGNAANVEIKCAGKTVTNGETVEFSDWTIKEYNMGSYTAHTYSMEPNVTIEASDDCKVNVTFELLEEAENGTTSMCWPSECYAPQVGTPVEVKQQDVKKGVVNNMQIHFSPSVQELVPPTSPTYIPYDPEKTYKAVTKLTVVVGITKTSFTLVMTNKPSGAGVDGVGAASPVKVMGNALHYSLSAPASVSVYAITGACVKHVNVSGTGNISLANLPKGVYIYAVGGSKSAKGKFVVR